MQKEIIENAVAAGIRKTSQKFTHNVLLGIMAGCFIALGGTLAVYLGSGVPGIAASNPGVAKLLSAMAFPVGLFLIVMFGGELFTGNNALLMPALKRGHYTWRTVVSNWTMVWTTNLIGAVGFTALLVYAAGLLDAAPYDAAVRNIAIAKTSLPWWQIIIRGIGANWCVCLAVWLTLGAKTIGGKALVVWIPVGAFVILGFEHCIANMFYIPAGLFAGADISASAIAINLACSTFGNIIGGSLLVGMIYNHLYGNH